MDAHERAAAHPMSFRSAPPPARRPALECFPLAFFQALPESQSRPYAYDVTGIHFPRELNRHGIESNSTHKSVVSHNWKYLRTPLQAMSPDFSRWSFLGQSLSSLLVERTSKHCS